MLDRERKRVPNVRSDALKEPLLGCTPLAHGKSEYPTLNEENEKEKRDEETQRGMEELYRRRCGSK